MKSQYSLLPTTDPDQKSAFKYGTPGDLSSGRIKFNSIFSYANDSTENDYSDDLPAPPSLICRICTLIVTFLCYFGFILTLPISGWFCFKTVNTYERYVVFRLGHYLATKGPGMILILRCIDRVVKVDLRMKAFSVPPQKILTNDNAAIEVGADVYYRIADPVRCVSSVQDRDNSIRVLAQTSMQNQLSKQVLYDIESNRPILGEKLQESINKTTKRWGIEVSRVAISEVKVIKGPAGGPNNKAQSLLNMVAPGLIPAGTSTNALPQGTPSASGDIFQSMIQGMTQQQQQQHSSMPMQHMLGLPPGMSSSVMAPIDSSSHAIDTQEAMAGTLMPSPLPPTHATVRAMPCLETPQDLITAVKPHLNQGLVQEHGLTYKFCISGPGGGVFHLDLKNGEGSAGEGDPEDTPDVTFNLSSKVMTQILKGGTSAFGAYMSGQLGVDGDVQGAMKLGQLVESLR